MWPILIRYGDPKVFLMGIFNWCIKKIQIVDNPKIDMG
jgi:hypothetical protein